MFSHNAEESIRTYDKGASDSCRACFDQDPLPVDLYTGAGFVITKCCSRFFGLGREIRIEAAPADHKRNRLAQVHTAFNTAEMNLQPPAPPLDETFGKGKVEQSGSRDGNAARTWLVAWYALLFEQERPESSESALPRRG